MKKNKVILIASFMFCLGFLSNLTFGQTANPRDDWQKIAFATASQVDRVVVQVETLECIIQTEMSNPAPCERKKNLLNLALDNLKEARLHFDKAHNFVRTLQM